MAGAALLDLSLMRLGLRMLFGDCARAGMIGFGVLLSSALMMQQLGLFTGLIARSQNAIADAVDVDIWVMNPATRQFNLPAAIPARQAVRVAGVSGVKEAATFSKASVALVGPDGRALSALLFAMDDAHPLGGPALWLLGDRGSLRTPGAVAIDRMGFKKLWPGEPVRLGKRLEIGGRSAVIAGVTEAAPVFGAEVMLYARRGDAERFTPALRPSEAQFVLARLSSKARPDEVARRIEAITGLKAMTSAEFSAATKDFYLKHTGIAKNFMTTIMLGIVAGVSIVGLTFSLYISGNMAHYAVLKTVGISGARLTVLALAQIAALTLIGFGLGAAIAYGFFAGVAGPDSALRGFRLEGWIVALSFAIVVCSVLAASAIGLWRVWRADPALVFREAT